MKKPPFSRRSRPSTCSRIPDRHRNLFCGSVLMLALLSGFFAAASAQAADDIAETPIKEVQFNPLFLARPNGGGIDVSRFSRENPIQPGEYMVDLYLNDVPLGRQSIRFAERDGAVIPCLGKAALDKLNISEAALPEAGQQVLARAMGGECIDLRKIADNVTWDFEMADFRLDMGIPQALLRQTPRDYVAPEMWMDGVTSATLSYNLNSYRTTGDGGNTSTYLGLDSGLNIGNWHLRHRSSMNWDSNAAKGFEYESIDTYAQRDLPSLKSQLTVGDSYTDGSVFDSYGIRGVQVATDDRMLPGSMRGYAPQVRGVAQSNARVTITQNGIKIYETSVAPGPFDIKDLYATGYGGDLQVTVTEADGSQHSFAVPYASVSQLLRPGTTRYSAAAGELRNTSLKGKYKVAQATVQHGFNNYLTGYAGLTLADGYQAGLLGAAVNTPVGALALDVTQASADIPGVDDTTGQSVRLSYAKSVPKTNTNVSVAASRYSTGGFWDMNDAYTARERLDDGADISSVQKQRGQLQLTLNQNLGERWGSVYVSGSSMSYWDNDHRNTQFQVGYNNSARLFGTNISYNVSASRQRDNSTGELTNQIYAGVTLPLGRTSHAPTMSMGYTANPSAGDSQQVLLTGSALDDHTLSYSVNASHSPDSSTGGGNLNYQGRNATVSASASAGAGYMQYSAGVQGAVVAHPGGVTLANSVGDTFGIVEAKGAEGARVVNAPGVHVNDSGYAVVPYLTPYSLNTVELDPKGLPLDVELKSTTTDVVPRANSVVMIPFETSSGRTAIIEARQLNGKALPFGATVRNAAGTEVGTVGQGSRAFVRGIDMSGTLQVKWGDTSATQCNIRYDVPDAKAASTQYTLIHGDCVNDDAPGSKLLQADTGASHPETPQPSVAKGV